MQQPQAGLEIKAPVSLWFFMLQLFPAKVSIDGSAPMPAKWGDNLIPMTPGRHTVSFCYLAYWFLPVNKAEVTVDIAPGQVVQLRYKYRWFIFMPGIITQTGVRPMLSQGGATAPASAAQPAGWHPDPAGRHEMRYWNGSGWTDDVSDAGVAVKDPMG